MHKVLIANRGEIALRIVRACRDLGLRSVAVCSTADLKAPHVRLANESLCIGEGRASTSYLQPSRILAAAELAGADAIHPGYGFLSENARCARLVEQAGLIWVGPPSSAMEVLSNKVAAKAMAGECGIPTIPGSPLLRSPEEAHAWLEHLGSPALLKTAHGGGGRGIRRVHSMEDLPAQWAAAWQEAQAAYGNAELYLEREIERPRHVEVQVLGDGRGTCLSLGERDCSIQRRRQKVVEEAPGSALSSTVREQLGAAAVALAERVGYRSAGTAEFLVEPSGAFYFMEFNSRLQVEHTVTEAVTGVDLVCAQLQIAAGSPFYLRQEQIRLQGHAIQWRLTAEDPSRGFAPSPGRIERLVLPAGPGIRVDTGIEQGSVISPYYDPLIAKIIVQGPDRETALRRSLRALHELEVEGVAHNGAVLQHIASHPLFKEGGQYLGWLEEEICNSLHPSSV